MWLDLKRPGLLFVLVPLWLMSACADAPKNPLTWYTVQKISRLESTSNPDIKFEIAARNFPEIKTEGEKATPVPVAAVLVRFAMDRAGNVSNVRTNIVEYKARHLRQDLINRAAELVVTDGLKFRATANGTAVAVDDAQAIVHFDRIAGVPAYEGGAASGGDSIALQALGFVVLLPVVVLLDSGGFHSPFR